MDTQIFNKKRTINCKGKIVHFDSPKVMGILNLTPDSFYDGGKYTNIGDIQNQIDKMITEGVDIIDIGAVSSRPGAIAIKTVDEIDLLKPVLDLMLKKYPEVVVSVDTFRSEVAEIVVRDYGVAIINDISAGNIDSKMLETIGKLQVPYVLMHMKGLPANMQQDPIYGDVLNEILTFFSEKLFRLKELGIHDVILDPGFGFGKSLEHNYILLNNLEEFKITGLPIMVGISRKSMIHKHLNIGPAEALNGTTVLNTIALMKHADILRVHDVLEAKQAIELVQKCKKTGIAA